MLLENPYEKNTTLYDPKVSFRYRQMKHACGENPDRVYSGTRMDTAWAFRQAYDKARQIKEAQDEYCAKANRGDWAELGAYPEDLQWEALVDVLRGRVKVHTHCYETVDLDDLVRITNEFKFPIAAFHHAHETYLVPDTLKSAYGHTPAAALFASHGRYKREAYRGSSFAPRILAEHGLQVVMKSDHPVLDLRFLLWEAQQAYYYGLPHNLALAAVTSTPATVMGQSHRIGFLKEGMLSLRRRRRPLGQPPARARGDPAPFYGFNQVEHLHVRGSPADLHLFLDYAVPCRLQTHTVEFDACAPPAAITRCVEVVWDNDRTRRSVLRELTLVYPTESYRDEEAGNSLQDAALVDVVRPALAIRGLRKVTLAFHEIPSLDNAGVLEMVEAWPKLTALHILPSTGARYRAHTDLTPAVLVALARHCPRLVELTLPEVKLGDVHETEEDMPVVGQRAMRKLSLFFCHWVDHDDVLYTAAVFLDRLFPCLDLRPLWEGDDEDDEEDGLSRSWDERGWEAEKTWRRIEEYLYCMQLGRQHRAVLKNVASL
ncbi:hypothetical protein GSI_04893 [Ganoderma sinense ZZ0214-1]|uniref:Amidohydrolase-related domain-containing protein n=1 Tax=Ganoderma sinense ZZ0214-1 TaxID=1077348 RepID=A0A2G8SG81_9APHY|nr:hypothetical protein GSI_04893 [Ganoderma sinense ZZ0214-1]